nr:phosphoglycerate mutase family protein [Alteromonas stellipolaris]
MTDIYLVRHGQASFGAANYDKLSDLGAQQSKWLGHYFKQRDITFDSVFMGDMVRHRETAEGIAKGAGSLPQANINSELNEFNFQAVATAFLTRYPDQKVPKVRLALNIIACLKKPCWHGQPMNWTITYWMKVGQASKTGLPPC